MGLGDVGGVLSRYFIVGYWVPSLFTLFALSLWLSSGWIPDQYEELNWDTKVLVLGGLALVIGLALQGFRYPITRTFEGYGLDHWYLQWLRKPLLEIQRWSYDRQKNVRDNESAPARKQTQAARLLDRQFPRKRELLLPTRFGNAYRASENYSYTRYGLDTIAIWPRIDQLLTDQERDLHTNAASDLAFFLNGVIGSLFAGVLFAVDAELKWWECLLPFVLSYSLYRASVGAAERLGTERRASIDLHRLELYERLGVSTVNVSNEDRRRYAQAVNRFLLWGEAIPETFLVKDARK